MSTLKTLCVTLICFSATSAAAQRAKDDSVLAAKAVSPTVSLRIYNPIGKVRVVAWSHDSVVVRGRVANRDNFFFAGGGEGVKLGVEAGENAVKLGVDPASANGSARASDFVVYIPKASKVWVRTVSASIDAVGASGTFYTVSGPIHLSGAASSVEAESMNGSLDLDVTTPWLRARTGDGHLLLRGSPQDVDVSTISGTLDIATTTPLRAQFSSVSGDIHYVASPARGAIFEFSNHSGNVDMVLPESASGAFTLSSITGAIQNGFTRVRPAASTPNSLRLTLGNGGASVTVRTYKGAIRLRPE
jgi:hypothetical protein